jgi:hypothetical protein
MNNKFISYNFQEIEEEVQIVLQRAKSGMTHEEFYKSVQHIYHHLNIAWNSRNTEAGVIFDIDDPQMEEWSQFPDDLKLM